MKPKLYSRDTCAPCRMLKQYLDRKGVDYELINVDEQPAEFEQIRVFSNSTIVPQLAVGMQVVVGLHLPKIIDLLDL